MALLIKNKEFKGLVIDEVYCKIWKFEGDKSTLSFGLSIQVNKEEERLDSYTFVCPYNIDGINPIAQAYEYLKTLDEYSDAVDC